VNLQDRNELAVIDPATDKAVARYPVEGCKGNHGMALDVEHQRAFLACQGNDRLTVFDLDTHKAIVSMPLAAGSDVVQFDAGLGRLYVAVRAVRSRFFRKMTPTTSESWRMYRCSGVSIVWRWIFERIAFMCPSRKRMGTLSHEC